MLQRQLGIFKVIKMWIFLVQSEILYTNPTQLLVPNDYGLPTEVVWEDWLVTSARIRN